MIEYYFHPSRKARELLDFENSVFSVRGNIILADLHSSNQLVEKINQLQDSEEKKIRPAQFYAICLLHEIYHHIINCYRQTVNPKSFSLCDAYLGKSFSRLDYETTLSTFLDLFPPPAVFRREQSPKQFLKGETDGISHRDVTLEELILVYLQNQNPALNKITELIGDDELRNTTIYIDAILRIEQFFDEQPQFGPDDESLIKMLLAPLRASPASISGQLEYIKIHWRSLLERYPLMLQILRAEDFLREEERYFLMRDRARDTEKDLLKESPPIPTFRGSLYEVEEERFSQDLNWMSKLVLIAKSMYVWLDQLSKKYQRSITRLDQIPNEELDQLASQGFNGLWFIGIWQRSQASRRIKHLSGNPEALASAYSINNYTVAPELGGEDALGNLQMRALQRGIRLASDMVPNHMGIDSEWVINHPDWFIQIDQPPFPVYSFNGPNVSSDERVGIFLEDGYRRKSDAAVVFKRLDRWTGSVKYVYHGNDGTHLPWNDTAQLNFLLPEVREAVIQAIIHVARLFPIIRFDAAMVLTKRHYQRLWFPEPGTGGAIPSRSSFGLTKEKFDSLFEGEFWREVVDRIQQEAPDTLLLAEAFWLLEGYFVRTLGMHRVYNSAFMNMLKKEENAKYRSTMKNVLEYNPQILKRFVNFMNNPDEETAVAQFGKGDKYFGICLMMVTLPGLPMFGHGQIEGFQEKYGMEYHRAYYDEQPDQELIARHEREIFPLLKKRYLFSEVDNFFLYDFFTEQGIVNENVFVYSNRSGGERALIVCNNKYEHAHGWIRTSVGYRDENGSITQRTLGDGLALSNDSETCTIFRDLTSGLEYIHINENLWKRGLFLELGAYKYHVFLNLYEVKSANDQPYIELARSLNGRGVQSIAEALWEVRLRPLHDSITNAITNENLQLLFDGWRNDGITHEATMIFTQNFHSIIKTLHDLGFPIQVTESVLEDHYRNYATLMSIIHPEALRQLSHPQWEKFIQKELLIKGSYDIQKSQFIFAWLFLHHTLYTVQKTQPQGSDIIDTLRIQSVFKSIFDKSKTGKTQTEDEIQLLLIFLRYFKNIHKEGSRTFFSRLQDFLKLSETQHYIGTHRYNEIVWFNKEKFETLVKRLAVLLVVEECSTISEKSEIKTKLENTLIQVEHILALAIQFEYQFENFLSALSTQKFSDQEPSPSPQNILTKKTDYEI